MKKTISLAVALLMCTPLVTSCSATQNVEPDNIGVMPKGQQTDSYKVGAAGGIMAGILPKNAEQSTYRYAFNIELKDAMSVNSIKIERLNADGSKTLIIDDSSNKTKAGKYQQQTPAGARSYLKGKTLGNITWVGQSAKYNMTKSQAPWLYKKGTTRNTYLITITDLKGNKTTLTQNSVIQPKVKKTYLNLLN